MILSEKLKLVVCLVLALSVAPVVSPLADEADSIRTGLTRENALHPGMWSVMFQIDEQFTLRPFNGLGIALKRQNSRKSAFRFGVNLNINTQDDSNSNWAEQGDTIPWENQSEISSSSQQVSMEFLYVNYPWPDAYVNFYWGAGPQASFSRSTSERESTYLRDGDIEDKDYFKASTRSWSAGAKGIIGAEWFANRRISFQMEYQASLFYRSTYRDGESSHDDPSYKRKNEDTGSAVSFKAGTVIFGVSMYF